MIKFLLHGGLSHHPERPDDNHMLGLSSGLLISRPGKGLGTWTLQKSRRPSIDTIDRLIDRSFDRFDRFDNFSFIRKFLKRQIASRRSIPSKNRQNPSHPRDFSAVWKRLRISIRSIRYSVRFDRCCNRGPWWTTLKTKGIFVFDSNNLFGFGQKIFRMIGIGHFFLCWPKGVVNLFPT